MLTVENQITITAEFDNRYINQMVDTLAKKTSSSIYIAKDSSRQVAMKSLIGLLSGGFKKGDEVKLTVISEDEHIANRDLKLVEGLLNGEQD